MEAIQGGRFDSPSETRTFENGDVDVLTFFVADDGSEMEAGPGDVYVIQPGHDAWVVGEDTFEALEFASETAETYARGEGSG